MRPLRMDSMIHGVSLVIACYDWSPWTTVVAYSSVALIIMVFEGAPDQAIQTAGE